MSKISVIGAGNVGASCAEYIGMKNFAAEVVLLDIKENFAEGKAMDLMQTSALNGFETRIIGSTNDYSKTAGSDVVVITSGIPRKPGMTREELIGINAGIVDQVMTSCLEHSPEAIFVIVSNPMDTMTYLAKSKSGLPKNRIIGMGGALDSARFRYFLSTALGVPAKEVEGMVIGGHGDIKASTMVGGATLTGMLGTSAWYAPGAAVSDLVQSIVCDQKKMMPCCVSLEGEYGQKDICIGVPVVLGASGWEKIVELDLNDSEKSEFAASAEAVRTMNGAL
jgi:malate dehydrogenase